MEAVVLVLGRPWRLRWLDRKRAIHVKGDAVRQRRQQNVVPGHYDRINGDSAASSDDVDAGVSPGSSARTQQVNLSACAPPHHPCRPRRRIGGLPGRRSRLPAHSSRRRRVAAVSSLPVRRQRQPTVKSVANDGLTHQCRQRLAQDHAAGDYGVKGESTAGNNTVEPRLVIRYLLQVQYLASQPEHQQIEQDGRLVGQAETHGDQGCDGH